MKFGTLEHATENSILLFRPCSPEQISLLVYGLIKFPAEHSFIHMRFHQNILNMSWTEVLALLKLQLLSNKPLWNKVCRPRWNTPTLFMFSALILDENGGILNMDLNIVKLLWKWVKGTMHYSWKTYQNNQNISERNTRGAVQILPNHPIMWCLNSFLGAFSCRDYLIYTSYAWNSLSNAY